MKLIKNGTYFYGDDPYKLLGNYSKNGGQIYSVEVYTNRVVLHLRDYGGFAIYKEGEIDVRFDYYSEDTRTFLNLESVTPDLIGKVIKTEQGYAAVRIEKYTVGNDFVSFDHAGVYSNHATTTVTYDGLSSWWVVESEA